MLLIKFRDWIKLKIAIPIRIRNSSSGTYSSIDGPAMLNATVDTPKHTTNYSFLGTPLKKYGKISDPRKYGKLTIMKQYPMFYSSTP